MSIREGRSNLLRSSPEIPNGRKKHHGDNVVVSPGWVVRCIASQPMSSVAQLVERATVTTKRGYTFFSSSLLLLLRRLPLLLSRRHNVYSTSEVGPHMRVLERETGAGAGEIPYARA